MKKIILILVVAALVIAAATYLGPWATEYEVKTAARIACNDLILEKRTGSTGKALEGFVRKSSTAGVKLKEGQYAFSLEESKGERLWRCHYKVAYKSSTPVFLIADFFTDVPPFTLVHRIDAVHEVRSTY